MFSDFEKNKTKLYLGCNDMDFVETVLVQASLDINTNENQAV